MYKINRRGGGSKNRSLGRTQLIQHATGLPTKDESVKTTDKSKNVRIPGLN